MSSAVFNFLSRPPPMKRRRTATGVLAGDFDPRPPRDVLTSLLNGVGPYKLVEGDEEERRARRQERKQREREKKKAAKKQQARVEQGEAKRRQASVGARTGSAGPSAAATVRGDGTPAVNSSTSSFWRTRGPVIPATRSVSPTPPPELSSPPTPGPSISSTMSYGSSKRPHTPEDGSSLLAYAFESATPPPQPKPRKKRVAARKGWKGWVEGSPPPSNKLINLDEAPVMVERRLRSGKNFDAISEGKDTWINPAS